MTVRKGVWVGLLVVALAGFALLERQRQEGRYRALLAEGERALAAGQTYAAIETFSGILALRPSSMVAYYHRGEAYRAQRQYDRAISDLREAARLAPEAPEPLSALAGLFEERGEYATAAEWYGRAADLLDDADPVVLYRWALALYKAGMPAAALEPLNQALERDNGFAAAHHLLGLVLEDAQRLDEAAAAFERAARLAPGDRAPREALAHLYRAAGRTAEELKVLDALRAGDTTADRDVAAALALVRLGRFDEAEALLASASTVRPADSRLALAEGRVLLARAEGGDSGAASRALAVIDRALGGTAPRSEGLALFGRALYLTGDATGAERILAEAVATSPVDPEAFGFLADAAEALGHVAAARNALLDLDVLEGDTAPAAARTRRARRIGALSLQAGDPRAAAVWLTQAVDAGVADSATLGLLARARWESGDESGARLTLTRALALAPADATLLRLQRTIR